MKKILYVTTLSRTINAFLVPHITALIDSGNTVDCACYIDKDRELPIELKRLIERNKAQYGIEGEDEEILKRIIPKLEDEDIVRLYDELCEEENNNILYNKGYRPNFEKYREVKKEMRLCPIQMNMPIYY